MSAAPEKIAAADYQAHFTALQHIFLVGNLQRPSPHPFFRDSRLEVIVCEYQAGDHGRYHWHPDITEYEFIIEGSVVHQEAATGKVSVLRAGDLSTIPAGACVQRIINEPCRTLAIKVPSNDVKIHCAECSRECQARVEPFQESA